MCHFLDYKFEQPEEAPPPQVDDELRRKEEEELQRVLEMSVLDKGGRNQWNDYGASSSGAGGSSSATASHDALPRPPASSGSAVPATSSYNGVSPAPAVSSAIPAAAASPVATAAAAPAEPQSVHNVTRVRALHSFQPTEPGELQFEKGDIIKVVDRNYKDWWRGQLRGRTGIFPVNYVVSFKATSRVNVC